MMPPGTIAYPQIKGFSDSSCEIKWICGPGANHKYIVERKHLDENEWIHVATVNGNSYVVNGLDKFWLFEYKISVLSSIYNPLVISYLQ